MILLALGLKENTYKLVLGWDEVRERLGDKLGDKLGFKLGDNEWKILKTIWENPTSSIPEIARKVGATVFLRKAPL